VGLDFALTLYEAEHELVYKLHCTGLVVAVVTHFWHRRILRGTTW
jgi:hypothetical protein